MDNLLWLLTGLAVAIIALTRLRLVSATGHAGHSQVPRAWVNLHTVAGAIAMIAWIGYLVTSRRPFGWVALAPGWIFAATGIAILLRWLPGHGRHASRAVGDGWTNGPVLSIVAHVGVLLGVGFCTAAFLLNWRS